MRHIYARIYKHGKPSRHVNLQWYGTSLNTCICGKQCCFILYLTDSVVPRMRIKLAERVLCSTGPYIWNCPATVLQLLTCWKLCSLLVWHKFGRGQHRYTLLRHGIKVYVDVGNRCPQVCEVQVNLYLATKQYWQSIRYLVCRFRCNKHCLKSHFWTYISAVVCLNFSQYFVKFCITRPAWLDVCLY